ncbi:sensory transduction protein kinase [Pseudoalteromonas luteoviolacea B = ATCC 29581]|nr:sensory transduction protein kinase [Pseudoalteromonas luteoviolacea B = ATCC 29581]
MIKSNSLQHYLATRLFIPFALFSLLLASMALFYYWSALDDTAEYYLFEDAFEFLAEPIEKKTQFRSVVATKSALNQQQQHLFDTYPEHNVVHFVELPEYDVYLLNYTEQGNEVFVVHQFEKTASHDIRPILFSLFLLGIVCILVWFGWQLGHIKRQLRNFTENVEYATARHDVVFDELTLAQNKILDARAKEHAVLEREKAFSQFLSHEIRHPLSLLGNHLAAFSQMDNLSLAALNIIDRIQFTQQDMMKLSNAILTLWSPEKSALQPTNDLVCVVQSWIETQSLPIQFTCSVESLPIALSLEHLQLALSQITTNYRKYGQGELTIGLSRQCLTFTNSKKNRRETDVEGTGVGLFILRAVAAKAGGDIDVITSGSQFTLMFNFAKRK